MEKIVFSSEYFNIKDTLNCGQVFRFRTFKHGFLVFSKDKCCFCYEENGNTVIETEKSDKEYFYNYFDLERDYSSIVNGAVDFGIEVLKESAVSGKGIRILNQDKEEALFSFIISQNNNIPRIKGIIERLCERFGEKKRFLSFEYYTFPKAEKMALTEEKEFYSLGLGYRAPYIKKLAESINKGLNVYNYSKLPTDSLRKELVSLFGVGPKVADCVVLFGYHRADSFPVDTWLEKVYKEDFGGNLTDRKKITEYFLSLFKENAGYYQQYLFYYKRSLEKEKDKG